MEIARHEIRVGSQSVTLESLQIHIAPLTPLKAAWLVHLGYTWLEVASFFMTLASFK